MICREKSGRTSFPSVCRSAYRCLWFFDKGHWCGEKGGRGGADSWRTEAESGAFRCASSLSASGMKGEQRLSHPRRHFSCVRIWFERLLPVTKLIIGIGFYSLQLLTDLVKTDSERNSWGENVNLRKIVWNEGLIPLTQVRCPKLMDVMLENQDCIMTANNWGISKALFLFPNFYFHQMMEDAQASRTFTPYCTANTWKEETWWHLGGCRRRQWGSEMGQETSITLNPSLKYTSSLFCSCSCSHR